MLNLVKISQKEWKQEQNIQKINFEPENLPNYIERKQIKQEEIQNIFLENHKQIILLSSLQMTGKTTISKKFANSFQESANNFCYILNHNRIYPDLNDVATLLEINDFNNQNVITKISEHLIDYQSKCVFIIDDLVSLTEDIYKNIPNNIYFLITTKDSSIQNQIDSTVVQLIQLDPFTIEECLDLFELSLKSKLSIDEEDKEEGLERLKALIQDKPNKLEATNRILDYFKTNELDSFDEIMENIETNLNT